MDCTLTIDARQNVLFKIQFEAFSIEDDDSGEFVVERNFNIALAQCDYSYIVSELLIPSSIISLLSNNCTCGTAKETLSPNIQAEDFMLKLNQNIK